LQTFVYFFAVCLCQRGTTSLNPSRHRIVFVCVVKLKPELVRVDCMSGVVVQESGFLTLFYHYVQFKKLLMYVIDQ